MTNSTPISHIDDSQGISEPQLRKLVTQIADTWVLQPGVERLLLLPPDHTRLYSYAGQITAYLWEYLHDKVKLDVLPALGTHKPMSEAQLRLMFGPDITLDSFIPHNWLEDLKPLGSLPEDFIAGLSQGRMRSEVTVAINKRIVSGEYDLALSIGQVVPHEVIGFANYTKNICIGCGGGDMLHQSHFLGAVCGIESILGEIDTPVRQLVDEGFNQFVRPNAEIKFLLTVVEDKPAGPQLSAFIAGEDRDCFLQAAELSKQLNVTEVEKPIDRCLVYLDPREFTSTWLGNKAVYRTRKAIADGGELIILAPSIHEFGEAEHIDSLIRKYGYRGTKSTLASLETNADLAGNLSAAAHLIHGSSEGRFQVTYCPGSGMQADEITSVGYNYRPYEEVYQEFKVEGIQDGWHDGPDGKPFYYIQNPALGLWTTADLAKS